MLDKELLLQSFDNREQPDSAPMAQYERVAAFDKSAAFGFGNKEDYELGRMAEYNKIQMNKAMGDMRGLRKTNTNFNKKPEEDVYYKNGPKQSKSPMFKATFRIDSGKSRQIPGFDDGTFATTNHNPWTHELSGGSPVMLKKDMVTHNKTDSQVVYGQELTQSGIGGTRLKRHMHEPRDGHVNSARPKTNTTSSRKNLNGVI